MEQPYFLNFIITDKDIPEIFDVADMADSIGDIICTAIDFQYLQCSYDIEYIGGKKFNLVLLFDENPDSKKVLNIIRHGFDNGTGYTADIK